MEINGRDVRFFRSVLANCKVADAAPDGDIKRFWNEQLLGGSYSVSQRAAAVIMTALSEGYEIAQHAADPKYRPQPLTEEEVMSLKYPEFNALYNEAIAEWFDGGKRTVEPDTEPKTEKKTEEEEAGASG